MIPPLPQLAHEDPRTPRRGFTITESFTKPLLATRSRIGIQLKDGSIRSAYHHWDGYPEWLGVKLQSYYNTKELATKLIRGGDMSSCWTDERWTKNGSTKSNPHGAQYYKARGENVPSRKDKSLNEYLANGEEYAYLFVNDEWICYDLHGSKPKQVKIPPAKVAA